MIIMEELKPPHPQCPCCNMLVTRVALNECHPNIAHYTKGAERKQFRMVVQEIRDRTEKDFRAYGHPLNLV